MVCLSNTHTNLSIIIGAIQLPFMAAVRIKLHSDYFKFHVARALYDNCSVWRENIVCSFVSILSAFPQQYYKEVARGASYFKRYVYILWY